MKQKEAVNIHIRDAGTPKYLAVWPMSHLLTWRDLWSVLEPASNWHILASLLESCHAVHLYICQWLLYLKDFQWESLVFCTKTYGVTVYFPQDTECRSMWPLSSYKSNQPLKHVLRTHLVTISRLHLYFAKIPYRAVGFVHVISDSVAAMVLSSGNYPTCEVTYLSLTRPHLLPHS